MKRVVVGAGFLASLVLAANTYADPIYGTADVLVGAYDKDYCGGLNLPKCEESKIEYFVGDYGGLYQSGTNSGGWVGVNDYDPTTNLVAFNLSTFGFQSPIALSHFAIKIGNGNSTGLDIFVFKNNTNLQYAVIDLNVLSAAAATTVTTGKISHVAVVPEPGSLLLIGVGALTATAVRRRQRSLQGQVISRA